MGKRADEVARTATLLGRALAHGLRIDILTRLGARRRASPSEVAATLGVELGTLSYRVRQLHSLGPLRAAAHKQNRGAVEHFYELIPIGHTALAVHTALGSEEV